MEGIIHQRVTPLLKCGVLFLFIFTARVLTSRPQESQDDKGIQHLKPAHYVRTFTKYHHRRTIQYDPDHWPTQEQPKVIQKRSIDNVESNEFINNDVSNLASDTIRSIAFDNHAISTGKDGQGTRNGLTSSKTYKEKPKEKTTSPPTTKSSSFTCIYKPIATTTTPTYPDDKYDQQVVDSKSYGKGEVTEEVINGETVNVEHCTDPQAYCFTLLEQDIYGNTTILGQGCWQPSSADCGWCRAASRERPAVRYCCCRDANCNADYESLPESAVTMKAESTIDPNASHGQYLGAIVCAALVALGALLAAVVLKWRCGRPREDCEAADAEKGDVMGSGPDALATGLLCVDNLTLIEHIGAGKSGSVWRGRLGARPVAVKLYASTAAWQREAAVYGTPHLAHPNILRYYGSDSRPPLTGLGPREQLIVVEACAGSLRARLARAPLEWAEFATLAHGLAAALAHLHTPAGAKPCVVHRDVNSNNVLIAMDGRARLADLGLAQPLARRDPRRPPARIAEAGTLRYLSPEALEGALDLSGARAALCAVDVFALGLVLWEMLWRTSGAHHGRTPPYMLPYEHHGVPAKPTLAQMQSIVSRNKLRPPLPAGGAECPRALKLAADTCDECWDHDAEARLTAVCVEERMCEVRQLVAAPAPRRHDNRLQRPGGGTDPTQPPEPDKNSNCTSTQTCDVTTPLLYPQTHIGHNISLERNTYTPEPITVELLQRSLRDVSTSTSSEPSGPRVQNIDENCLSVARSVRPHIPEFENSDRLNEIRAYQRPLLDYVQNDVSSHDERKPKQTNLQNVVKVEKPKWGIRSFFEKKLGRNSKALETEVKLMPENSVAQNGRTRTSIVNDRAEKPSNVGYERPPNLVLSQDRNFDFEVPCTLSPPNRTLSPTMMLESDLNRENNVFGFKELPNRDEGEPKTQSQIFAVIVPKAKPSDYTNLIEMRNKRGSSESINKQSVRTSMSSQSIFRSGNSESEDSTVKKRLSCDNRIITNSNSAGSSRASINLELQYIDNPVETYNQDSPFDVNSDCSSSEDEHLMLLSENGGSKITMQTIPKNEPDKKKYQNEVLKESSQTKTADFTFNKCQNKYANFDNEFSDPNDKENLNGYSGDNPVYLAAFVPADEKAQPDPEEPRSPKPPLKKLTIKRQHSLEQVSELFASSGDLHLQNPAGRVKTPGDLPVAVRRARRDRALQKGRASESNRLSLYDDRMMFGNSL